MLFCLNVFFLFETTKLCAFCCGSFSPGDPLVQVMPFCWPKTALDCWGCHQAMEMKQANDARSGWWFGNVWNMFFNMFGPYIGNDHPRWLSYFSEGLKPPEMLLLWSDMSSAFDCLVLMKIQSKVIVAVDILKPNGLCHASHVVLIWFPYSSLPPSRRRWPLWLAPNHRTVQVGPAPVITVFETPWIP